MKHGWMLGLVVVLASCHIEPWRYDVKLDQARLAGQDYPDTAGGQIVATDWAAPHRLKVLTASDREFIDRAGQGGMFEVETSRLALKLSGSHEQREFAEMMISDHGLLNARFAEIVHRAGGILPTALAPDLERKLDDLRSRSGPSFEHRYHDLQISGHDEAIKLFESAAHACDDADLREFARTSLPLLRHHRAMLSN